jgi:hypothetical protein
MILRIDDVIASKPSRKCNMNFSGRNDFMNGLE